MASGSRIFFSQNTHVPSNHFYSHLQLCFSGKFLISSQMWKIWSLCRESISSSSTRWKAVEHEYYCAKRTPPPTSCTTVLYMKYEVIQLHTGAEYWSKYNSFEIMTPIVWDTYFTKLEKKMFTLTHTIDTKIAKLIWNYV